MSEKPASKGIRRAFTAIGALGVIAVGAAIALRFTIFVPYKVPSASMWPTFPLDSHIMASRLDKVPVRGAIMVFEYPEHPSQLFTKRVVAVGGDQISVNGGHLTINGWEAPHCTVGHVTYKEEGDGATHGGDLELEYLGDATYLVFHDKASWNDHIQGPWTVKPGEYFVVGDNRDNSHDSRMWFNGQGGSVAPERTVGRVRIDLTKPVLPAGEEQLQTALNACLAKKPTVTSPPSSPPGR